MIPAPSLSAALRAAFGLAVLVALIALVGRGLHDPVAAFSSMLVARLGTGGLFLAVLGMEGVPGLGFQPALFFGYTGGLALGPLFLVTWAATWLTSVILFGAGRALAGQAWLVARLERWGVGPFLRRHGARAIALAAVAPFPYPLATLGAGATGVPFRSLALGALCRAGKILFTLCAIWLGWGAGA